MSDEQRAATLPTSPGELVEMRVSYRADKEHVLELVLTDQAIYWRGKKAFALVDDEMVVRAPYDDVQLAVGNRRRWIGIVLGLPCLAFGALWIYTESWQDGAGPLAVGLALTLLGSTRRVLTIEGASARFRWKGPVIFDRASRSALDQVLAQIARGARSHGVNVEWSGPPPPPERAAPPGAAP